MLFYFEGNGLIAKYIKVYIVDIKEHDLGQEYCIIPKECKAVELA